MNSVKRPTRHETEEDILRMQNEFLNSDAKPAAKVVRCKRKDTDTNDESSKNDISNS